MSLFKRLWENFLSEGNVDNIGYECGKNVNTSLTKVVGHGSRLQVLFCEERTCLHASTSDIRVMDWSLGGVCGGETCTPAKPIVSKMALIFCFFFIKVGSESICQIT